MKKDKEQEISEERKKYLKKVKLRKIEIFITQICIVVALIGIWEILARLGKIDSFITSQPSRILKTFLNLSSSNLLEHVRITCTETIIGFLLGTVLGGIIAIILWWSPFISKVSEPFLVVLNSLPKIALGPVIIIWVGARNASNHCNGTIDFFNSNSIGNIKWISSYRQRKNKDGENI